MNLRDEIKIIAIVGTAQKEPNFAAVTGNFGETLAKLDYADREKYLLSTAAVNSIWENAGKVLPVDKTDLPEVCEPETLAVLNGNLKQIYETLLNSSDKSLLPEFLELMKQHGVIIPPELLPLTFALSETHPNAGGRDFRHQILPVVGNRGKWLARQNPGWRWVSVEESGEEIFETGKTGERTFALEYLRNADANKARELLQNNWKSESAKDRQKFLEIFEQNVSGADEEFLDEIWSGDKSSEVRRTAADLAARLPNSILIEEMKRRAAGILTFNKGGFFSKSKIEVNYPNDFDSLDKKDFLSDVQLFLDESSLGKKAVNLVKILSFIPPDFWAETFSASRKDVIGAAINSDWKTPLIFGFALAAERFSDADWLTEIINLKLVNKENPFWNRSRMMPRLRNKNQFENIASQLLQSKSNLEFLNFAAENQHQYSTELSKKLLEKLYVWLSLASKDAGSQSTWKLYFFAETFALKINHTGLINYLNIIQRLFQAAENTPGQIKSTLDILEFRLKMHEAFSEE